MLTNVRVWILGLALTLVYAGNVLAYAASTGVDGACALEDGEKKEKNKKSKAAKADKKAKKNKKKAEPAPDDVPPEDGEDEEY